MIFINGNAYAGFKLKKTDSEDSSSEYIGSSKVDKVEQELINAIKSDTKASISSKPKSAEDDNFVTGFGQDLPLVISLQQIIPSRYQFTLDADVDANTLTSWEGGDDWQKVLTGMLGKYNLSYIVKSDMVIVQKRFIEPKKEPAKVKPVAAVEKKKSVPVAAKEAPVKDLSPKTLGTLKKPAERPENLVSKGKSSEVVIDSKNNKKSNVKFDSKLYADEDISPMNIISSQNTPEKEDLTPLLGGKPIPDAMAKADWIGHKSQTLKEVLTDWGQKEGVELYWTIDYDYKLNRDVALTGEYEVAVARLLDIFRTVRPQPYGELHKGDGGPLVLVVSSYDLSH